MADLKKSISKIKYIVIETAKAVALALALVALLKGSVVEANQIMSSSMTPTLIEGDLILVNKIKYGLHLPFIERMLFIWSQPKRGDVITFTPPSRLRGQHDTVFIKRVIAVPGDRLEIARSMLYINGIPVETYKSSAHKDLFYETVDGKKYNVVKHNGEYSFGPVVVPRGYVFTVGDNRDSSLDSRDWGPLPIENIEGKAMVIYFSKAISLGMENIGRIGSLL